MNEIRLEGKDLNQIKNIRRLMYIVFASIFLVGCRSSKNLEAMTPKEFKKNMENQGFTVVDKTSSAIDSTYQQIYVGIDEEKYSFEYYFMRSDDSAEMVYEYAVSNLNNVYAEQNVRISEEENDNIKKYSVMASDYYFDVIKKENTVLYVTAYNAYADEAKTIVKELGY